MRDRVTALILDRPTCVACIGAKAGLTAAAVEETLAAIAKVVVLRRATDRCRACGTLDTVLSVQTVRADDPPA